MKDRQFLIKEVLTHVNYSKQRATWWFGTCYHEEQLTALMSITDIKNYAWILHDKDTDPVTGKLKKPHYHFLIHLYSKQRGSWFKQFSSDDLGEILHQPCYAPQGAYDYLTHSSKSAIAEGKYIYDMSELHSTITELVNDDDDMKKIELTKLRELILDKKMTPSELLLTYELSSQQIYQSDRLYSERMSRELSAVLRENIKCYYLYGKPRTGKTSYIYGRHTANEFYRVTNYKNPFDNYAYQKILVLDEFDSQLDIEYVNNILDIYPCELSCRFYNKWAAWTTVYVISNIPLTDQYRDQAWDKRSAFQSRIHEVKSFTKDNDKLEPLSKAEAEKLKNIF